MIDDPINIAFEPPDADIVWEHDLKTCAMLNVVPEPRERAQGLIAEWSEVLSGRPEPTQQ